MELTYLTPKQNAFEEAYIKAREEENRVYSSDEIRSLPYLNATHDHYDEWKLRIKSTERFIDYIKNKSVNNILDLGCGNGWFTSLIAKNNPAEVLGMDVNDIELRQAFKTFKRVNLTFAYGDVFKADFQQSFDVIVLNSSIQYFENIPVLIERLKSLLVEHGEIHIIDSPLYDTVDQAQKASERTKEYYSKLGFPEMSENYHHHLKKDLEDFEVLYKPSRLSKIIGKKDVPFGWYRYTHEL